MPSGSRKTSVAIAGRERQIFLGGGGLGAVEQVTGVRGGRCQVLAFTFIYWYSK